METPFEQFSELRPQKKIVANVLQDKQFDSVLEYGSQWGEMLLPIRDMFPNAKLVGIDVDKEVTNQAREITHLDLRFGDIFDKNFHDKEFDVVFTEALFCMLNPKNVEEALEEVIRVANKYIVLVELEGVETSVTEFAGYIHGGRTGADWVALFKKFGLTATKTKISEETWEANPWKDNGYIYVVDLTGDNTSSSEVVEPIKKKLGRPKKVV